MAKYIFLFFLWIAGIAEYSTERLALCNGPNNLIRDILIKAGNQVALIISVNGTATDNFGSVRHGERQTPLKQATKQQVLRHLN